MAGPSNVDMNGTDDQQARRWLSALRTGNADEKAQARRGLAEIFEARGMVSEAVDLLVTNAREGHRDAELFQALARMYRKLGDEYLAASAALEATRLSGGQPAAPAARPRPPDPEPVARPAPVRTPPPPTPSVRPTPWRLPLRVAGWIIALGMLGAAGVVSAQHPIAAALYLVSAAALGLLLSGVVSLRRLVRLPDGPLGDGALLFISLLTLLAAGALLPRPLTVSGSQERPADSATPGTISTPSRSPTTPSPSPSPTSPAGSPTP